MRKGRRAGCARPRAGSSQPAVAWRMRRRGGPVPSERGTTLGDRAGRSELWDAGSLLMSSRRVVKEAEVIGQQSPRRWVMQPLQRRSAKLRCVEGNTPIRLGGLDAGQTVGIDTVVDARNSRIRASRVGRPWESPSFADSRPRLPFDQRRRFKGLRDEPDEFSDAEYAVDGRRLGARCSWKRWSRWRHGGRCSS